MAKRKHSADWMLARVREYLSGKGSYRQIARANGISVQSLRGWVRKYEKQGEASFKENIAFGTQGNSGVLPVFWQELQGHRRAMTFPTVRYTIG